ncbi:hypothetical protein [Sulfitobacter sp.]|uniref:hypothetical protein n=1 Tax=Sulfitobacter sp. TaxID=1903071 RepID=UPI003002CD6B
MGAKKDLGYGDDIISSMENWGEKTLAPVSILMGQHAERCAKNRKQFKENDIVLTQAHASACSAFLNFISRCCGKQFDEVIGDPAQQLDLITHFIHGINLCEIAIVEGLYTQAATLLRQEHELISAVQELGVSKRKDGKTPHATFGRLKNMGKVYGELSGAAHVSQSHLMHDIIATEIGDRKGPSVVPLFHRELARNLYALHVSYICQMTFITDEVHGALGIGNLLEEEKSLLVVATKILHDEGLIEIEVDKVGEAFLKGVS